jgi:hypothetical protein
MNNIKWKYLENKYFYFCIWLIKDFIIKKICVIILIL